jgi:chromate reductase
MKILLLCGSFRQGSYNQTLLNTAKQYLSEHELSSYAIEHLPFYDAAIDGNNRPDVVQHFLDTVTEADAIIIASPEFNHSIPAVLKNAIDWASRPAFNSPLKGKPVTTLSASPSPNGGNLLHNHLKQVLDSTLSVIYPSTDYCVSFANEKITDGKLHDTQAINRLERHINGFIHWADKVRQL